ncbi:Solute carrier family 23 member 1 [Holothuria leucospilota]|uniref:Solute carrier family 23 member 1 n=1 Tax=Holothuria leucospilota TaxID=206669 RepID=A0A9Q1CLR4_HOLLE|nr:Solute carrier family 23 member 1 [Holothuria leucospilota]
MISGRRISFVFVFTAQVLLTVIMMWVICAILTTCGVFPEDGNTYGYEARTDLKAKNLRDSAWISFPYPGNTEILVASRVVLLGSGVIFDLLDSSPHSVPFSMVFRNQLWGHVASPLVSQQLLTHIKISKYYSSLDIFNISLIKTLKIVR